jgi:thiamine pyrophosphate-dependent acetolactate synthase large subunit-like protein
MVRGYNLARTAPQMPVIIVSDEQLQENPVPTGFRGHIPKAGEQHAPAGDPAAVNEVARMLVNAETPLLIAGLSARTPNGINLASTRLRSKESSVGVPAGMLDRSEVFTHSTSLRGLGGNNK